MPSKRLIQAAEKYEPRIKKTLLQIFKQVKNDIPDARLVELLSQGNLQAALDELRILQPALMRQLQPILVEANIQGAQITIDIFPQENVHNNFAFDLFQTTAAETLRTSQLNLIRLISSNTRQAIESALVRGLSEGLNPRSAASLYKDTLGLTPNQEAAVRNYRKALESGDMGALNRELRDRRSDKKIRRLFEERKSLPQEQIDKLVDKYRQNYITHRAETIARTESLRAVDLASQETERQMVASPDVDTEGVVKDWIPVYDARTRNAHLKIPGLNPNGVSIDSGVFETPLGPLRFPRDPLGAAKNTINCRCTIAYRRKTP